MDHPACIDITCLNAGAIMCFADKAEDLKSGIRMSRELICDGSALEKLVERVGTQTDRQRKSIKSFETVAKQTGWALIFPAGVECGTTLRLFRLQPPG